jgi:UDP-2,3-diacylglucosamine hydrolase
MSIYIVSDLHIRDQADPLLDHLLNWVDQAQKGDHLILAGDLFDLFIGNKQVFRSRYGSFIDALRRAGDRGVKSIYIEGNHDFQIGSVFRGIPGFEMTSSEVRLEVSGKKFYIAHGDQVDRSDYKYLAWRLFTRSPLMKSVIAIAPGSWVDSLGKKSSQKSRQTKPLLPSDLPRTARDELRKTYRNFAADRLLQGYDFVVLGHCHDLDEMCFSIGDRSGQYVNVGYPRIHDTYLAWSPGESKIRRENFSALSRGRRDPYPLSIETR